MWSKIWGFISGLFGGGVVSAVGSGLKLADDVVVDGHDRNQQAAGAAEQRDVTNAEVLRGVTDGGAAARDRGVIDLVRARNQEP